MLALKKTIITEESIKEQGQASGVGFLCTLLFLTQIALTEQACYVLLGSVFKNMGEGGERKRTSQLPADAFKSK